MDVRNRLNNTASQIVLGAGVSTVLQPFTFAKTLIQIGYEPLEPVPVRTLFGRSELCYPNVLKYVSYIKKKDGFFGLYRGVGARIVGGAVGSIVTVSVQEKFRTQFPELEGELDGDEKDHLQEFKILLHKTALEMVARSAGIIAAQPFHVIMVRSIAAFVGGETEYDWIFSAVREIYRTEGFFGFFSGLTPRLLGDALTLWLAAVLAHVINNFLIPKEYAAKSATGFTNGICSMMVTQLTYPFSLVSNVMAVSSSNLAASRRPYMPEYLGWAHCWRQMSSQGQLKRGSSMFWRYYRGNAMIIRDSRVVPVKTSL